MPTFDPKQLQMFQNAIINKQPTQETEEQKQLQMLQAKMLQDSKLQALKQFMYSNPQVPNNGTEAQSFWNMFKH